MSTRRMLGRLATLIGIAALAVPFTKADVNAREASPGAGGTAWLQFRGDRALTGRSRLKGKITRPAVRWKSFLGAREVLLEARFDRSPARELPLSEAGPGPDADPQPVRQRWGVGGPWHDLDGQGRLTPLTPGFSFKIGKLLPDRPGLQKLEADNTQGQGIVPGFTRLLARKDGEWAPVWQSEAIPYLQGAQPILGDFDADGRQEVALTPWHDLHMLDLATGKLKAKARFVPPGAESGRGFGWFGAFDLNGDRKQEFVLLADFENHLDVLGWKDGKLQVLWQRLVEPGILNKKTVVRPGASPIQDIDGDSRPEIALSIFNEAGDGKWHVLAFDGMTGRVKLDLPDRTLSGLRDLDGDGTAELFCTQTRGRLVPEPSSLSIMSFRGGKTRAVWQQPDAAFVTGPLEDFPLNVNSSDSDGRVTLLAGAMVPGDRPFFFTRRETDGASGRVELTAWQAEKGGPVAERGRMAGPGLEALSVRAGAGTEGGVLLRARIGGEGGAALSLSGAAAREVAAHAPPFPLSTPVVAPLAADERPSVVVQDASERVVALEPGTQGQPRQRWNIPGRGTFNGSPHEGGGVLHGGVVLADLRGDGSLLTLAATQGPAGQARLVAVDPAGREFWRHDFNGFPGQPPAWNTGGLTLWFAGRFTSRRHDDVLVTLRRSTMHTDECYLLDGLTGREIWHRTQGGASIGATRGCGGSWMAVFDYDGDGLDDALCMYPDVIYVMRGVTGALLLNRSTQKDLFPGVSTFYAHPVVADFRGDGGRQFLYGASTYMLALLQRNAVPLWTEGPDGGTPAVLPGIGDVDGDGKLELLSPGHARGPDTTKPEFRCYDAATGRVKWSLPFPGSGFGVNNGFRPGSPTAAASADLDGDGRDECVVTVGKTLYAVGMGRGDRTGRILWSLSFPGNLGPAAIADAEGSGRAQVVVLCGDGYLYGVE